MKWLKKEKIRPIYTQPGDSVILSDDDGVLLTEEITERMTIDEVGIFEFKDEFEMESGIGGIFGKSKD